jgi:UDPglucose 6-dehydrogenase
LGDTIEYFDDHYEALRGADALLLLTEWNLFRNPDFPRMIRLLREPLIFDGRNQYKPEELARLGFTYTGIGCGELPKTGPSALAETKLEERSSSSKLRFVAGQ